MGRNCLETILKGVQGCTFAHNIILHVHCVFPNELRLLVENYIIATEP